MAVFACVVLPALSALTAVTPSPLQVLVLGRGFVQLMVGLEPGAEGSQDGGWGPAQPALLCWTVKAQRFERCILHTPREKSHAGPSAPGPRLFSTFYIREVPRKSSTASALQNNNKKNPEFFLSSMVKLHYFYKLKNNTRIATYER